MKSLVLFMVGFVSAFFAQATDIKLPAPTKTDATLKNSLYDSYIKAFRWASDRIGDSGVIAYVSNAGWIDGNAMNGFRRCLVEEFSHIYVFNLKGNQRTSGERSRREGGKIFGSGSRAPIAITVLVKLPNRSSNEIGQIHHYDIEDYLTREQKLQIISDFHDISAIPWQTIHPDAHGDWLNQRNGEFDAFVPLAPEKKGDANSQSFFTVNSGGMKSNRDAWVCNYSAKCLADKMKSAVQFYNSQVESTNGKASKALNDRTKISWTVNLFKCLEAKRSLSFDKKNLSEVVYRPQVCAEIIDLAAYKEILLV